MQLRNKVLTGVLAAAMVIATAASASAATAYAASNAKVRDGAGTKHGVVDTLHYGEKVNVTQCTKGKSWCYITHKGPDGWVKASLLDWGGYWENDWDYPYDHHHGHHGKGQVCFTGPHGYFCVGN